MDTAEQTPAPAVPGEKRQARMLIDGTWVDSLSGASLSVENPAKRTPVAEVPRGDAADVDSAVAAAARAFPARSKVAPRDRGRLLLRVADTLETRSEEMARTIALETGNALRTQARPEAAGGRYLPLFWWLGRRAEGRDDPARRAGAELYAARADRRRRCDHPVECAGAVGGAEDRSGAVCGQHDCAQGGRGCSARSSSDGRDLSGVPATRRAQRVDWSRRGVRGGARRAPIGPQALLHRLDRGRQS